MEDNSQGPWYRGWGQGQGKGQGNGCHCTRMFAYLLHRLQLAHVLIRATRKSPSHRTCDSANLAYAVNFSICCDVSCVLHFVLKSTMLNIINWTDCRCNILWSQYDCKLVPWIWRFLNKSTISFSLFDHNFRIGLDLMIFDFLCDLIRCTYYVTLYSGRICTYSVLQTLCNL